MTDPISRVPEDRRPLLDAYSEQLRYWNARVNLVSRSTEDRIHSWHIPHCLAIAHRAFPPGSLILDWGTGGGLPAVPLAIAFPDCTVVGVDSTGKKIAALRAIQRELGLVNLEAWLGRAESYDGQATHCVSRATAPLKKLWQWSRRVLVHPETEGAPETSGQWPQGLVCLKGGALEKEIRQVRHQATVEKIPLVGMLGEDIGTDKYILHLRANTSPTSQVIDG